MSFLTDRQAYPLKLFVLPKTENENKEQVCKLYTYYMIVAYEVLYNL